MYGRGVRGERVREGRRKERTVEGVSRGGGWLDDNKKKGKYVYGMSNGKGDSIGE